MRQIDADNAIEVAQIKYNDWNLAMAAADGQRQINLCFKKQELFKAVKSVLDCVPTLTPPTQEQVERVWPGCNRCKGPDTATAWERWGHQYCSQCGRPLSLEAWEELRKKLEALKDGKGD